jgi:hypothetical protein
VTADVVAKEIASELVGAIIQAAARAKVEEVMEDKKAGLGEKIKDVFKCD